MRMIAWSVYELAAHRVKPAGGGGDDGGAGLHCSTYLRLHVIVEYGMCILQSRAL